MVPKGYVRIDNAADEYRKQRKELMFSDPKEIYFDSSIIDVDAKEFSIPSVCDIIRAFFSGLEGIWTVMSFVVFLLWTLATSGILELLNWDESNENSNDRWSREEEVDLGSLVELHNARGEGKGMVMVVIARCHGDSNIPCSLTEQTMVEITLKVSSPPYFNPRQLDGAILVHLALGLHYDGKAEMGDKNGHNKEKVAGVLTPSTALQSLLIDRLRRGDFEFATLYTKEVIQH